VEEKLTFEQLFSDLVEAERKRQPPPESFTVKQLAQRTGLSIATSRRRLERRVEKGELESDIFLDGKTETRFYWFV
jgi:response regulator of citrate/malate metabolism